MHKLDILLYAKTKVSVKKYEISTDSEVNFLFIIWLLLYYIGNIAVYIL